MSVANFLSRRADLQPLPLSSKSTSRVPTTTAIGQMSRYTLYGLICVEVVSTLSFYIGYDELNYYHNFLGALLLGASTLLLAQTITEVYKSTFFSWDKHFKFVIWGFINGVFSKLWIDFILINYAQDNFMKILLDQLLGNPISQLVFVIYNCIWENNDFRMGLQASYWKTMKYSLFVFPVFSAIAFTMLPESYIFPVNCLVTLSWNIVLSFIA